MTPELEPYCHMEGKDVVHKNGKVCECCSEERNYRVTLYYERGYREHAEHKFCPFCGGTVEGGNCR